MTSVETLESRTLFSIPAAPSGLSVSISSPYQLNLSWADNSSNETGFTVDRATDSQFQYDLVSTTVGANTTTFGAASLLSNITYYFRVRATNTDGNSAYTAVVSGTTPTIPPVPSTPTNLAASAASASQINLSWTDVTANYYGYAETSYLLERATDSGFTQNYARTILAQNTTSYSDTNLQGGTTYYYRLRAAGQYGWSSATGGVNATTLTGAGQAPTVANAASASPSTITGTSTGLSVLGADDGGESSLLYTWSTSSKPSGAADPILSINGTNAAKNTTATFSQVGSYSFLVTIKDANNCTTTSSINVQVNSTLTSIAVSPATASVQNGVTQQLTAIANDQFGQALATQPSFTWSVDSGGLGTISSSGLYSTPSSGSGATTIRATSGMLSGSSSITVTAATLPAAATSLVGSAYGPNQINLTWTDNANNETSYVLERATDPNFVYDFVSTSLAANATSYSATGLLSNAPYYFRVRPVNAAGASANSNVISVTTYQIPPVPNTPTNLAATAASGNQVNLSWTDVTANSYGYAETSYLLDRATDSSFTQNLSRTTLAQNATSYTDTGLQGSTTYYYRLRAVGTYGWSSSCSAVSVTTAASGPGIATPASASPATVAGTSASLSVLGTDPAGESTLSYTWSTLGTPPATVVFSANGTNAAKNTTATFTKAGTYSFLVTLKDTANYSATSTLTVQVSQTLTSIVVSSTNSSVADGTTQQLTAVANDQFGQALATQPSFAWSLASGGGSVSSAGLYTAPTSGAGSVVVRATSGSINGTCTLSYDLSDHGIAFADSAVVQYQGGSIALDVLANDTAAKGHTLSIAATTQPAHGTVQVLHGTIDRVSYQPAAGFTGTDTFTYSTNDGNGNISTAQVQVTVLTATMPVIGTDSATGVNTYQLGGGFTVNVNAIFTPTAMGNYSYTVVTPISSTTTSTDSAGNSNSALTSGNQTLIVTSTIGADGSWTYSEVFTRSNIVQTTPVISGSGSTQTDTVTQSYGFQAGGNAATSTFTFTSSDSDSLSGSMSGDTTGSWTATASSSSTLSSTANLSTRVAGGSTDRQGNYTYHGTLTSPYTASAGGGTASGSVTITSDSSGSYHYLPDGTGTGSISQSLTATYSGGGTYSYAAGSGTVSGTISASGGQTTSMDASWGMLQTNDQWVLVSGSGSASGTDSDTSSYNGSGSYAIADGSSGTISESGQSTSSGSYTLTLSITNGQWASTGTGTGTSSGQSHWSYTGGGGYSTAVTGGSVVGTTTEHGGQDASWDSQWGMATDSTGTWVMNSGSGTIGVSNEDHSFYRGSGKYQDGDTTGTITEGGGSDATGSATVTSTVVGGQWISSGTGEGSLAAHDEVVSQTDGTYTTVFDNGSLSGTTHSQSDQNTDSKCTWQTAMNPDGSWTLARGNGTNAKTGDNSWDYSGSGTFADHGVISESASGADSGGVTLTMAVSNGAWASTGGRVRDHSESHRSQAYSNSKTYAFPWSSSTPTGSVSGTIAGSSQTGNTGTVNATTDWAGTLDAQGNLTYTSGSSTTDISQGSHWSYSGGCGSNDLQVFLPIAIISGSGDGSDDVAYGTGDAGLIVRECGSGGSSSIYHYDSSVVQGAWVTTGTVQFTSNGDEIQAYGDNGVYASGGGVTGSAHSSGTWEDSYDFHGQGAMNASANWTYSGSGTSAQSQSDYFNFAGASGGLTGGDGGTVIPICTSVTTNDSHPISGGATMQSSSTSTTGRFLSESGSRSDTLTTLTTWVLDPNGTWRVTQTRTTGDGDASGSVSSSDVNNTQGSVQVSPPVGASFTAVTYSTTSPSSASQQYHDTYHLDKTTSYDAAGHATTSGSGWGTSTASGSASQHSTVDVVQSGPSSHHGDSSTQVSYSYSGGWMQDYSASNAPATTFGTNTISGQSSYLSEDNGGPTFSGTTPISSTTSGPGFGGFYTGAAPSAGSFGNPGWGSNAAATTQPASNPGTGLPGTGPDAPLGPPLPVAMAQPDRLPAACPMCLPSRFKITAVPQGPPRELDIMDLDRPMQSTGDEFFMIGWLARSIEGGAVAAEIIGDATKEAVEGAVSVGARTEARNLAEQLALEEAQSGAGTRIMEGAIKDPRFPADTWAKMQYNHGDIVIHYWKNLKTGELIGFKFK